VSKLSKPAVVAGAVAGRARDGTAVVVSSIGPDAVCNAMVAVCRARIYLEVGPAGGEGWSPGFWGSCPYIPSEPLPRASTCLAGCGSFLVIPGALGGLPGAVGGRASGAPAGGWPAGSGRPRRRPFRGPRSPLSRRQHAES
jgi:hypothetical protein